MVEERRWTAMVQGSNLVSEDVFCSISFGNIRILRKLRKKKEEKSDSQKLHFVDLKNV